MSVDELVRHQRGEQIETQEYRQERDRVLRDAGLESNEPVGTKPLAEQSAEDFFQHLQKGGR